MHRKSHETRRCPTCLRDISRNSITQHINAGKCSPPETSDLIPVAAWEAKLTKWLAHAKEVPEGTLCIFDHLDVDPVFSSPARAASIISSATDMLLVIPAAAFPQLSEAERYRKRKKPDVEQPDQRPEPARPRPAAPRIGGTAAWGNVVAA